MQLRPEVLGVTESPLLVIGALADNTPGTIKLCYGESDLPTPEFICRAADEAVRGGHTFYTHTAGYDELRDAIAEKVHELHGVSYRRSQIMSTVGASMAIYAAIRATVGPGDNAVIISPTYSIFVNAVIIAGAEPRTVALSRVGAAFHLDLDRVSRAIDGNTRMLIVNTPNNPTGWVMPALDQQALLELAAEHDLIVLSDEVYDRIVFDRTIAPSLATAAAASGHEDRVIVVNSFSKTYNMTGWRLGWAQSSEPIIRAMYKAVEFMTSNASAMVQRAGIVALHDGEPFVADLRAQYAARRTQVLHALAAVPGISLSPPAGAFFAFPRVAGLTDSAAFAERLVREAGVALTPGSAFGDEGEGYLRFCFASSESVVAEGLARFRQFMAATAVV